MELERCTLCKSEGTGRKLKHYVVLSCLILSLPSSTSLPPAPWCHSVPPLGTHCPPQCVQGYSGWWVTACFRSAGTGNPEKASVKGHRKTGIMGRDRQRSREEDIRGSSETRLFDSGRHRDWLGGERQFIFRHVVKCLQYRWAKLPDSETHEP